MAAVKPIKKTVDPTTADKSSKLYLQPNQIWINTTTGGVFMCTDTAAGTWVEMSSLPNMITLPIDLPSVADGDVVTTWTPGFAGKIDKVEFVVDVPVTTAAKGTTLNLEIGTTNLTGGVITLTSANCTPQGAIIAGTAITAANTFTATDTVSVEASSTTTFVEGSGSLLVKYSL